MQVYVQDKRLNIRAENVAEGFRLGVVSKMLECLEFHHEIIHETSHFGGLSSSSDDIVIAIRLSESDTEILDCKNSGD